MFYILKIINFTMYYDILEGFKFWLLKPLKYYQISTFILYFYVLFQIAFFINNGKFYYITIKKQHYLKNLN